MWEDMHDVLLRKYAIASQLPNFRWNSHNILRDGVLKDKLNGYTLREVFFMVNGLL